MPNRLKRQFVGYDDITDYVWDTLPPGEESDWNTALITEEIIETWPQLIGWHEEIAVAPVIESIIDDDRYWAIVAKHQYQ